VGHSYFCVPPVEGQNDIDWYNTIVDYEISPLLDEYWWDDKNKAEDCKNNLKKNIEKE
jgi:5-methylcytosine-specific restriction protein B